MKIYIMTDMEGVCGVCDSENWCVPGGRLYERGRELLSLEINAAIAGFYDSGADIKEILVVDGHGYGGIDNLLLDERAQYAKISGYPFGFDGSYDFIAFVGQHAKACTPRAHLAHTQSFFVRDYLINGVSTGEFGQTALLGAVNGLNVPVIFASGDLAFTKEAESFCPGIVTAAVKRGTAEGGGEECTREEYAVRNLGAIHLHPNAARRMIRERAKTAVSRFIENRGGFGVPEISAPFKREVYIRGGEGKTPYKAVSEHPSDYVAMMNSKHEKVSEGDES